MRRSPPRPPSRKGAPRARCASSRGRNLTSLDTVWTTAVVTRNDAYLLHDTLIGVDSRGQARPQMVEGWEISQDRLAWTFMLREGSRFHDGEPVTARDCAPSIRRWAARDSFGQVVGRTLATLFWNIAKA